MIATGLNKNEKFLQCKNSSRNDPTNIEADIEIVQISLDPTDTSSEWTLFYENEDKELCIDAFFIAIDLFAW